MTMNCERWDVIVDDFLGGTLTADAEARFLEHAADCERCGELLKLVTADLPELGAPDSLTAPDLTASVLAATSGPACGKAEALLGRRSDGSLTERDAGLLEDHLGHCDNCSELARTLTWVLPVVGEMAEPELDLAFTYDVLRKTVRYRERKRSGGIRRLSDRVEAWWEGQIRRPQFVMEIAFAATVVLVILFGTPLSPARETPGKALRVAKASPEWVLERAGVALGFVGGMMEDINADISDRRNRTAPDRSDIKRHGQELGSSLLNADFDDASTELGVVRDDIEKMWRNWRASRPDSLVNTP